MNNIWEDVIVEPDLDVFNDLIESMDIEIECFIEAVGIKDKSFLEALQAGVVDLDPRTYSLMLLIVGCHPRYELKPKFSDTGTGSVLQGTPSSIDVKNLRLKVGLNKGKMARLLGLSGKKIISEYESLNKDDKHPSEQCWSLFLLITNLHKYYYLEMR